MKFVNYLKNVQSVEIYPAIGLILFMSVFVVVLLYVSKKKRSELQQYADIPLN